MRTSVNIAALTGGSLGLEQCRNPIPGLTLLPPMAPRLPPPGAGVTRSFPSPHGQCYTGPRVPPVGRPTYIKDLKASDVQHTNEVLPRLLGFQRVVYPHDHPGEHLLIDGFGQGPNRVVHLGERVEGGGERSE